MNEVPKNKFSVLRVEEKEYAGHSYVEIREWRKYGNQNDMVPTNKAITGSRDVMKSLGDFLRRAL